MPNAVDPAGETTLMIAARVGVLDAVQVLLDRGAVVDAKDETFQQTALMVAVRENHPDLVQLLHRARRRREREDAHRPDAALGAAELGARLRPRHRHRPRRPAAARVARSRFPAALSPLLYAARDGRLESARHAARRRRGHRTDRRQRHHAAPHGDRQQPPRRGALPDRPRRRHPAPSTGTAARRCGRRSKRATWTWTTPRS